MSKPKLFAWSDFLVPTGYGNVAKHLYEDLHKYFDVVVLSINYDGKSQYDTSKYFAYATEHPDWIGIEKAGKILESENFDYFFLFQDAYYIDQFLGKYYEKFIKGKKLVIYFPLDGMPWNHQWTKIMGPAAHTFIYSKFCERVITESIPNFNQAPHSILYHGVDFDTFYPLSNTKIKEQRSARSLNDRFVIMNHNRYQPRKNWHATMRAAGLFIHGYKKCGCGNWYLSKRKLCEACGGTELELIETVKGHDDALMYCHCYPTDQMMGGNVWSGSLYCLAANTGFTDDSLKNRNLFIEERDIYKVVGEQELNEILNCANVGLTTTYGEGFGLTVLENMAVGTTNIAPFNTTMPEIIGNTGRLCKNVTVSGFSGNSGQMAPLIDFREVVKALEVEYQIWNNAGRTKVINEKGIERAKKLFAWDDKIKHFNEIMTSLLPK